MTREFHASAGAQLRAARRIVVKVGSAILCGDGDDGTVRASWLASLADDIAQLRRAGREAVVVTSGAIALGRGRLGLARGPLKLEEKQAASAAGQIALAEAWGAAFAAHGVTVAQILLTLDDTEHRRRYLNARAAMRALLDLGAMPLVNENDAVTTEEIRYGDNDRLAAHAAQIVGADLLVILSDVDGLYTADPRRDPSAAHLPLVEAITPDIEASAAGPNLSAGVGSGGMESKLAAAKIAGGAGCAAIIAPGHGDNPLSAVLDGGKATLFRAAKTRESARRQWIAGRLKPAGTIVIDDGAAKALGAGKSLLPAGVVGVRGDFARGDAVAVENAKGEVLAQGLSAYHADEIRRIAGRRSDEIEPLLGYRRRPAVIEKNDLVLRMS